MVLPNSGSHANIDIFLQLREHRSPLVRHLPVLILVQARFETLRWHQLSVLAGIDKLLVLRPPEMNGTHIHHDRVPRVLDLLYIVNQPVAEARPREEVDAYGVGDRLLDFGRVQPGRDVALGFFVGAKAPLSREMS